MRIDNCILVNNNRKEQIAIIEGDVLLVEDVSGIVEPRLLIVYNQEDYLFLLDTVSFRTVVDSYGDAISIKAVIFSDDIIISHIQIHCLDRSKDVSFRIVKVFKRDDLKIVLNK